MKIVKKTNQEIKQELIDNMKLSIGTKDPIEYFKYLTDSISLLFEEHESLRKEVNCLNENLNKIKTQTALSIHWEPKVALNMLSKQIEVLRQDKDMYVSQLPTTKVVGL